MSWRCNERRTTVTLSSHIHTIKKNFQDITKLLDRKWKPKALSLKWPEDKTPQNRLTWKVDQEFFQSAIKINWIQYNSR